MMASMSRRTRYVALASGGVLAVGLCGGLVAYLNRDAARGAASHAHPELAFVPAHATALAFADVRAVMASELRERVRRIVPDGAGREQLERHLGLDIERDIDRVLVYWAPEPDAGAPGEESSSGLALFRGRLDAERLEAVARRGGAEVSEEDGSRIVTREIEGAGSLAMAFLEPGLAAVGELAAVRSAARRGTAGAGIDADADMMRLLGRVDDRSSFWAVGRLGDSGLLGWVPEQVSERLPPVTAFAVQGRINGGISLSLAVEGRDDAAAQNLRDVVRGFVALAQLQTLGNPDLQAILDSLQTGGDGTAVTLSFRVPAEAVDFLLSMVAPGESS